MREPGIPRKLKGHPYYVCLMTGKVGMRVDISEPKGETEKAALDQMFEDVHAALRTYFANKNAAVGGAQQ